MRSELGDPDPLWFVGQKDLTGLCLIGGDPPTSVFMQFGIEPSM